MKILIVGDGAREQSIAHKLSLSPSVEEIYLCPGNGGTHYISKCENLPPMTQEELLDFSKKTGIAYTVVGPEKNLMEGIVDLFQQHNLSIVGPHKDAALLEGSKSFAKDFMKRHHIKTAAYEVFDDFRTAQEYLKTASYPLVIKADGLAQGKGVEIVENYENALTILTEFMIQEKFQDASKTIVVEEYLVGKEASIISLYDGNHIVPLWSTMDHKKIGPGETGLNTGGMGSITPNPHYSPFMEEDFNRNILLPTQEGLSQDGLTFQGIIFFGLMMTEKGVYLLEYNLRFGDPETQSLLQVLSSDLHEVFLSLLSGKLKEAPLSFQEEGAACVVLSSAGYPLDYKKGIDITDYFRLCPEGVTLYAYKSRWEDGRILSDSGRVLSVVASGNKDVATDKIYRFLEKVRNENLYYRNDIGKI
jgi:phosphoribosylamine--glycine ligase